MNVNCLNTKRFFLEYSVRNSLLQKFSNCTNEFFFQIKEISVKKHVRRWSRKVLIEGKAKVVIVFVLALSWVLYSVYKYTVMHWASQHRLQLLFKCLYFF